LGGLHSRYDDGGGQNFDDCFGLAVKWRPLVRVTSLNPPNSSSHHPFFNFGPIILNP
jgi:hypothetical protein